MRYTIECFLKTQVYYISLLRSICNAAENNKLSGSQIVNKKGVNEHVQ